MFTLYGQQTISWHFLKQSAELEGTFHPVDFNVVGIRKVMLTASENVRMRIQKRDRMRKWRPAVVSAIEFDRNEPTNFSSRKP